MTPGCIGYTRCRRTESQAAEFSFYVDDNRTTGNSEGEAWLAARRVASMCSYLGIQDAARKRRKASQTPGAWAGAVVATGEDGVSVSVSKQKWVKAKAMLKARKDEMEADDGWLDCKALERQRGFLLYVTRTYPAMVPYLKGFHLTINGWRKGRDSEGWKYLSRETREEMEEGTYEDPAAPPEAPKRVKAKPRLRICGVPALMRLFEPKEPPKRLIRPKRVAQDGFGFNMQEQKGDTIHYRFGQWCDDVAEKSSNYRELCNLVERLEELVAGGMLEGCEFSSSPTTLQRRPLSFRETHPASICTSWYSGCENWKCEGI
jgi:hypothetical protein